MPASNVTAPMPRFRNSFSRVLRAGSEVRMLLTITRWSTKPMVNCRKLLNDVVELVETMLQRGVQRRVRRREHNGGLQKSLEAPRIA